MPRPRLDSLKLNKASELIFALGLLVAVVGAAKYSFAASSPNISSSTLHDSVTERRLAVTKAIHEGRKNYEYNTRFTPGIGVIADPDSYLKQWQNNTQR